MPSRSFPVISVKGKPKVLNQIRWNNSDRVAMKYAVPNGRQITSFYNAARHWVEILRRPTSEYFEQLRPGRPLSRDLKTRFYFLIFVWLTIIASLR